MSKEIITTSVFEAIRGVLPRYPLDSVGIMAAKIIDRDLAFFEKDGSLAFRNGIADLCPRLAPPPVVHDRMSDNDKIQAALDFVRRAEEAPTERKPKPGALPTYDAAKPMRDQMIADPKTDADKVFNALLILDRHNSTPPQTGGEE